MNKVEDREPPIYRNIASQKRPKSEMKKTEIGWIPRDWEVKELSEITTSISSGVSKKYSFMGKYPVYGSTGQIGSSDTYHYIGEKILIARVGANAGTINRVKGKYGVSDNTLIINLKQDCLIQFVYYKLMNYGLNKLIFGSGQPLITGGQLKSIKISFPPLPEQKAIAQVLSEMDELIASFDALIQKKQAVKQGAMQQLLTGKQRLEGFEGEWEVKKISEIVDITTGNKDTKDKIDSGKYPFFVRSQTVERINSFSFDGEAVLTAGDGVGVGKVFHYINGKFDFHQRVYKISGFNEVIDGYYFYLYFSDNFLKRILSLTAKSSVDSVRMETISKMKIPLPPIQEQKAIAQILSDMDAEIEALQAQKAKYEALKQGAMQQLLTGKIRLI